MLIALQRHTAAVERCWNFLVKQKANWLLRKQATSEKRQQ